jgi:hypothetical protein
VAHSDLNQIIEQFDLLQLRKEQLENALGSLEAFLVSKQETTYENHQPAPIHAEPINVEPVQQIVQPALRAVPTPEPIAPAAFSPMPEPVLDPIQSRINRALGLAVAYPLANLSAIPKRSHQVDLIAQPGKTKSPMP